MSSKESLIYFYFPNIAIIVYFILRILNTQTKDQFSFI